MKTGRCELCGDLGPLKSVKGSSGKAIPLCKRCHRTIAEPLACPPGCANCETGGDCPDIAEAGRG